MQAVEFDTIVKNSQIFIPDQYAFNNMKVRVVIHSFFDEPEKTISKGCEKKNGFFKWLGRGKQKSKEEIDNKINMIRGRTDE